MLEKMAVKLGLNRENAALDHNWKVQQTSSRVYLSFTNIFLSLFYLLVSVNLTIRSAQLNTRDLVYIHLLFKYRFGICLILPVLYVHFTVKPLNVGPK